MSIAVLAALISASTPSPAAGVMDACAERIAEHPNHSFRPLHDSGRGADLLWGEAPGGEAMMLQLMPTFIPDADPSCERWVVGRELASAEARLVPGVSEPQQVTLHASDLPGMTAVVVVRSQDGGRVLAAGPFYVFGDLVGFEPVELGMDVQLLRWDGSRPDPRHRDEHGVGWYDLGAHLLTVRDGLVYEVGKSVALEPRWRDAAGRDCHVRVPIGPAVLKRGAEPELRLLQASDVPGWGARLKRGDSFSAELYAYPYRWRPEQGIFMVRPPYDSSPVSWSVTPRCE